MSDECGISNCPACWKYIEVPRYRESTSSTLREMAKTHPYIRYVKDVSGEDNPIIILFTDQQMFDIKRFCCRREGGTPLGIDTTHKHGNFQLTFTVYKDLSVIRESSSNHPICLGPAFIHLDTRSQTNVLGSFMEEIAANLSAEEVKNFVIGSKQEPELVSSVKRCFDGATHVFCTIQLKQKLNKIMKEKAGYTLDQRKNIVNCLFGGDGLTYTTDLNIFEDDVDLIRDVVDEFDETVANSGKQFRPYYDYGLVPLLYKSFVKPSVLGKVQRNWTNNNTMIVRKMIKSITSRKFIEEVPEFLEEIYKDVKLQTEMRSLALADTGNYLVDKRFSQHVISYTEERLYRSQEDWERRVQRFQRDAAQPDQDKLLFHEDPPIFVVKSASTVSKPTQVKRKMNEQCGTPKRVRWCESVETIS